MIAPTEDRPRVARPPIDPRIRDRRIEVIREAGRRRLRVTLVIASAIVVVGLAYLTVRSPLLDVDHIQVTGSQRESASAKPNRPPMASVAVSLVVAPTERWRICPP